MRKDELTRERITAAIVDDETHSIEILKQYLGDDHRIKIVSEIADPSVAAGEIISKKPELLFLDIQMKGRSGFEILNELEKTSVRPIIIFVTAFDHYAIQAIRAAAFDFLIKPVEKTELVVSVERAISRIQQLETDKSYSRLLEINSDRKIRFNTTGGFILVDPKEIIFVKADWNYSEIHTDKDKYEVVTLNIGSVEDLLPPEGFARISRSVIINLRYLEKVSRLKRLCYLKKNNNLFSFRIPIRRIRELEEKL